MHSARNPNGTLEVDNDDPSHHLSNKWLKEDISMAFSAKICIENAVERLEKLLGVTSFAQWNTPMAEAAHPELDASPLLDATNHSKIQSLVGCANWLVTLA